MCIDFKEIIKYNVTELIKKSTLLDNLIENFQINPVIHSECVLIVRSKLVH